MVRTRVLGVAAIAMVAVLTGCASGPPVDYSHLGADDVVFRFMELRGDPIPTSVAFEVPAVTVFGNGRVVRPVPSEGYPWPEVTQQWLTPSGMRRLLDAARDAGLAKQTDFGEVDGVVGSGGVVFRVVDRVTFVGMPTLGLTIPRMRVRAFMAQLGNLDRWMGWDLSAEEPYSAPGIAVIAFEQGPETGAEPAWPLSDLGLGVPVRAAVCTVYDAADLAPVRNAVTPNGYQRVWRSNGMSYWIMVRPLLPGDTGCASTAIEDVFG